MSTRTPVVFDLDGTLIDSLPNIAEAANTLLAEHALPPLPSTTIASFVGLGEQVFLDKLIVAGGLEVDARNALLQRFMVLYKEVSANTVLFEGVLDALQRLREMGVPMGLCTNKPGGPTEVVLRATGLDALLDVVVAGDTLPVRKPDPAPLLRAFADLGAETGLYVGDNDVDAQTAQNAKVPFALYAHGIRTSPIDSLKHDLLIEDFSVLPATYSKIFA